MEHAEGSTVPGAINVFLADPTGPSHHLSSRKGATDDIDAIARLVVAIFEYMRRENPAKAQHFIEDIEATFSVHRDLRPFFPQLAIWALTDPALGVVRYLRTQEQKQLAECVIALYRGEGITVPLELLVKWARNLEAEAKAWKKQQQEAIRWVSRADQRPYRQAWNAWWAVATLVDLLQALDRNDAARGLGAAGMVNSFSAASGMSWYAARRDAGDRQASPVVPIAVKVLALAQSLPVLETMH